MIRVLFDSMTKAKAYDDVLQAKYADLEAYLHSGTVYPLAESHDGNGVVSVFYSDDDVPADAVSAGSRSVAATLLAFVRSVPAAIVTNAQAEVLGFSHIPEE